MSIDSPAGKPRRPDSSPPSIETGPLAEEICFWQEMLAAMEGADLPLEGVERVQQALALAQYRLTSVQPLCRH